MKGFVSAMIIALVSVFTTFPASAQGTGNNCSTYTATAGDIIEGKDADTATNRTNLKNFVMNAKCAFERIDSTNALLTQLAEFRKGDWMGINFENGVYLFIFEKPGDETPNPSVLFNANNPEFEGNDLNVTDYSTPPKNVANVINENLEEEGGDGFSTYTWDDPYWLSDNMNEPEKSPGTTAKVSYSVTAELMGEKFVIGSGFYLGVR